MYTSQWKVPSGEDMLTLVGGEGRRNHIAAARKPPPFSKYRLLPAPLLPGQQQQVGLCLLGWRTQGTLHPAPALENISISCTVNRMYLLLSIRRIQQLLQSLQRSTIHYSMGTPTFFARVYFTPRAPGLGRVLMVTLSGQTLPQGRCPVPRARTMRSSLG